MAEQRKITPDQMADAEAMARKLAELPQEKQAAVVMMANAFMAGLDAQAKLSTATGRV